MYSSLAAAQQVFARCRRLRNGAKVVLVQDRSRLGGNSSSEVKMHIVGANNHKGRPGWREGGIIEELRLDDAVNNPQWSWEMWDRLLYDKLVSDPNITLLLDTTLYAAEVKEGKIQQVMCRCDKTEYLYRVSAKVYADCTGDARSALEAGLPCAGAMKAARNSMSRSLGKAESRTLGSSLLFTVRDQGRPVKYTPPTWARKITKKQLNFRPIGSWEYGYWWIEWGVARSIRFAITNGFALNCWPSFAGSGTTSRIVVRIPPANLGHGSGWYGAGQCESPHQRGTCPHAARFDGT